MIGRFRPDIVTMKAYTSARSLYEISENYVFLDANECGYEPYVGANNLSKYPSAQPKKLVDALCRLYDVTSQSLMVTRGADEAIDILIRSVCVPLQDNIIICPPTFPMYEQAAIIQSANVIKVTLTSEFQLNVDLIKTQATDTTKIIFLCSPNNPTGNLLKVEDMLELCRYFTGKAFVVVDETYLEYAGCQSLSEKIYAFPNLVVLRTLSKAYAAAGLRCGCAIANPETISILKKVLAPYPIPQPVVSEVIKILDEKNQKRLQEKRAETLATKENFIKDIAHLNDVEKIYPSDANFILVKVKNADAFCAGAAEYGYILRNQTHSVENCVRIAIGSTEDMQGLLQALAGQPASNPKNARTAIINRTTKETSISVAVNLDKPSPISLKTGLGFYDHMLEQIAKHAGFSTQIECIGDLHIDPHHTIEDVAIALGQALKQALGDKRGIERYGFTLPMDEAQASCVLDLSGRFYLNFEGVFPRELVGEMPTDMVKHVFHSLAENLSANVHIKVTGENAHHMVEACFKAFGRALKQAIQQTGEELPSSKGVL